MFGSNFAPVWYQLAPELSDRQISVHTTFPRPLFTIACRYIDPPIVITSDGSTVENVGLSCG